jgi:hypothetical protein
MPILAIFLLEDAKMVTSLRRCSGWQAFDVAQDDEGFD